MSFEGTIARVLLLAVGLAAAVPAVAQDSVPGDLAEDLTLAACFRVALRHNKEIQAAKRKAEAERARVRVARGAFDTVLFADGSWGRRSDPVAAQPIGMGRTAEGTASVGLEHRFSTGTAVSLVTAMRYTDDRDDGAVVDPLYESEVAVVAEQDLLRDFGWGANLVPVRVAHGNWQIALEGIRDSLIRNLFEVELAYWTLYFAEADLKVRETQLARANRLVEVAESQVRVGEAAPIEITRARSGAASQAVDILNARNRIDVLRNRLLRGLGIIRPGNAGAALVLADGPGESDDGVTLEASLALAQERRPDCRQATLDVANAEQLERLAWNQRLPVLKVYGGVGRLGLDSRFSGARGDISDGDFNNWEVGVRLEVPIENRAARGAYQAAQAEKRLAGAQRSAVFENATREVADAFSNLSTARQQIGTARQSRQLAEKLLGAEEKSFRLGRSSSLDVLDAQQAMAAADREEARARIAHATALSYLLAVRGDFLEAKGVPVEALDAEDGSVAADGRE